MTMRHHIISTALWSLLLCSCGGGDPIGVADSSFEADASVEYDAASSAYVLHLVLLKGDDGASYSVGYSVDGGYSLRLLDSSGAEVQNVFTASFAKSSVLEYTLPDLSVGDHALSLDISSGRCSRHLDVSFTVEHAPFSVHAEASTASQSASSVLVSLTGGSTSVPYDIQVLKDGTAVASREGVDFSSTPICTLTLPQWRPGIHYLVVTVTDGRRTESVSLQLDEPVRHPVAKGTVSYDGTSHALLLTMEDNPYGLCVSAATAATVTGSASPSTCRPGRRSPCACRR